MADNKYRLTIKIVDFDSTTNDEVVVGTFLNHDHHNPANSGHSKRDESTNKGETLYDRFSIRECIANKKFEGKLRIDKTDASIQVNIEAKAQKTLQQLLCSNKEDGFVVKLHTSAQHSTQLLYPRHIAARRPASTAD
jgi:hypothetical protein